MLEVAHCSLPQPAQPPPAHHHPGCAPGWLTGHQLKMRLAVDGTQGFIAPGWSASAFLFRSEGIQTQDTITSQVQNALMPWIWGTSLRSEKSQHCSVGLLESWGYWLDERKQGFYWIKAIQLCLKGPYKFNNGSLWPNGNHKAARRNGH